MKIFAILLSALAMSVALGLSAGTTSSHAATPKCGWNGSTTKTYTPWVTYKTTLLKGNMIRKYQRRWVYQEPCDDLGWQYRTMDYYNYG